MEQAIGHFVIAANAVVPNFSSSKINDRDHRRRPSPEFLEGRCRLRFSLSNSNADSRFRNTRSSGCNWLRPANGDLEYTAGSCSPSRFRCLSRNAMILIGIVRVLLQCNIRIWSSNDLTRPRALREPWCKWNSCRSWRTSGPRRSYAVDLQSNGFSGRYQHASRRTVLKARENFEPLSGGMTPFKQFI
jgi:hypothetical protein